MQPVSRQRIVEVLVWSATAAFAASWFMPVLPEVPGWMAFRYALAPLMPYRDAGGITPEDNVPQVLSALTNVVFLILFALWLAKQMFRPSLFVRIVMACLLLNLYWFVRAWRENGLADLLAGYYVWLAAFSLLLAAAVITAVITSSEVRRTSRIPTAGMPP
jgi:hypothetical protein